MSIKAREKRRAFTFFRSSTHKKGRRRRKKVFEEAAGEKKNSENWKRKEIYEKVISFNFCHSFHFLGCRAWKFMGLLTGKSFEFEFMIQLNLRKFNFLSPCGVVLCHSRQWWIKMLFWEVWNCSFTNMQLERNWPGKSIRFLLVLYIFDEILYKNFVSNNLRLLFLPSPFTIPPLYLKLVYSLFLWKKSSLNALGTFFLCF